MKVQATKTSAGKAKMLFLSVLMGIGAGFFFGKSYFVQVSMVFVGLAALAVFVGVNLVVLGFLIQKGVRRIQVSVRPRKAPVSPANEPHKEQSVIALLGAPPITTGERTGST